MSGYYYRCDKCGHTAYTARCAWCGYAICNPAIRGDIPVDYCSRCHRCTRDCNCPKWGSPRGESNESLILSKRVKVLEGRVAELESQRKLNPRYELHVYVNGKWTSTLKASDYIEIKEHNKYGHPTDRVLFTRGVKR